MQNPLWQVYEAFWRLLESEPLFTEAVPYANRIKYGITDDRHPDKDNALHADFPLVRIRPIGARPRPYRTSNSSMIEARWSIEIFTGDQRFSTEDGTKLFDVWFAVFKALTKWKGHMYNFTWNGNDFIVRHCRAVEVKDSLSTEDIQAQTQGWWSFWQGETDIWFTTTDLNTT